jgi:hypothetical protein
VSDQPDQRRRTHDRLAARLAALGDDELAALLADTDSWRVNGLGNQSGAIDVDGVKVFVKKIALTDLERTTENQGSTANLFDLPLFYHYGVGSAGFGAWRELNACLRAGGWALAGESPHFPLVYHWRVMPRAARPPLTAEQQARLEGVVGYWDHSEAVRARLEAIAAATASIVLFLEHVPQTLHTWMGSRLSAESPPDAASEAAMFGLYDQWRDAASFINERGMLHFDLHQHNVLTDGERLYVGDFGLAVCADFDLSPAERAFFDLHRLYDRCYVARAAVEWLAPEADPPLLTPALSALVERCAPVAGILQSFFKALRDESKTAPYPATELEAALAAQLER